MSPGPDLSNYNEVDQRIIEFRAKYPEGSLQSRIVELPPAFADKFICVEAHAYRFPDDERPGYGLAWEPVPGKTPYTRDSELMNAETSAWGRSLIAVGAADAKKGIASANEVRNRTSGSATPPRSGQKAGSGNSPDQSPPRSGGTAPEPATTSTGGGDKGEGPAPGGPPHDHVWKPSPRPQMASKGWEVCDCGETKHP